MKKLITAVFFTAAIGIGSAQVKTPAPSPSSTIKQSIGLSEITVEYSRPSANDRKIFNSLVPMNELWRTGANGNTDITFGAEALFNGVKVPAGKYALYTIPGDGEWQVILYKDTEIWGAPKELKDEMIVAKGMVKAEYNPVMVESFQISFNDFKTDKANLILSWENTIVKIPVVMDSKAMVMETIKKTLSSKDAKAGDYNNAANYFLQEKMDMKKALEYSTKANELAPNTFYMMKSKSEIQAANGMKKEAIATAQKSMELAKEAKNDDYIKINADNIAKWSK